ncbi:hypothetical protein DNX69_12905 [Rhodopseudomonas palustris]|uniref:Uncharacterized protein n=1 Tax=Rhodopseudomonas palustris TaxID=1076 RepID=A0A323UBP6_RHOPL|nr:DsrE family protein [Rhodopseudomonas palustris]PZA10282.1 hypothetical protein DNX69_12905 [Rhodopseudomonas palustris]
MKSLFKVAAAAVLLTVAAAPALAADAKPHRVAIQVDQNDPVVMNLALNNAANIIDYYKAKNEDVQVEVVTFGPGLHMLRTDSSPVKDRIKQISDAAFPSSIKFAACDNTKNGMEKHEGHAVSLIPQASEVPSGAVRLIELQGEGWAYLRP